MKNLFLFCLLCHWFSGLIFVDAMSMWCCLNETMIDHETFSSTRRAGGDGSVYSMYSESKWWILCYFSCGLSETFSYSRAVCSRSAQICIDCAPASSTSQVLAAPCREALKIVTLLICNVATSAVLCYWLWLTWGWTQQNYNYCKTETIYSFSLSMVLISCCRSIR